MAHNKNPPGEARRPTTRTDKPNFADDNQPGPSKQSGTKGRKDSANDPQSTGPSTKQTGKKSAFFGHDAEKGIRELVVDDDAGEEIEVTTSEESSSPSLDELPEDEAESKLKKSDDIEDDYENIIAKSHVAKDHIDDESGYVNAEDDGEEFSVERVGPKVEAAKKQKAIDDQKSAENQALFRMDGDELAERLSMDQGKGKGKARAAPEPAMQEQVVIPKQQADADKQQTQVRRTSVRLAAAENEKNEKQARLEHLKGTADEQERAKKNGTVSVASRKPSASKNTAKLPLSFPNIRRQSAPVEQGGNVEEAYALDSSQLDGTDRDVEGLPAASKKSKDLSKGRSVVVNKSSATKDGSTLAAASKFLKPAVPGDHHDAKKAGASKDQISPRKIVQSHDSSLKHEHQIDRESSAERRARLDREGNAKEAGINERLQTENDEQTLNLRTTVVTAKQKLKFVDASEKNKDDKASSSGSEGGVSLSAQPIFPPPAPWAENDARNNKPERLSKRGGARAASPKRHDDGEAVDAKDRKAPNGKNKDGMNAGPSQTNTTTRSGNPNGKRAAAPDDEPSNTKKSKNQPDIRHRSPSLDSEDIPPLFGLLHPSANPQICVRTEQDIRDSITTNARFAWDVYSPNGMDLVVGYDEQGGVWRALLLSDGMNGQNGFILPNNDPAKVNRVASEGSTRLAALWSMERTLERRVGRKMARIWGSEGGDDEE